MFVLTTNQLADAATIGAGIVAIVGILGPCRARFDRTVARRCDLYRCFERLGVGAHQSFSETVIDEEP